MRCLALMLITGAALAGPAGLAQERKGAGEAVPRPAEQAWVKLCETPSAAGKDFYGKAKVVGVKTCLVHHERLDATNGAVLMAAAVRQTGAQQTLMVMLPPVVQREPGARVYIYPSNLWEGLQRKEPLQKDVFNRVRMVNLKFAFCHAEGCTAETNVTPKLVADLKSSGGLMVFVVARGKPVALPITLSGFREVYDGAPVDSERYYQTRNELLRRLREGQKQRPQPPPRSGPGDQPI
jgi:invasion protein IalB